MAYMLLVRHSRFGESEINNVWFKESFFGVMKVLMRQLLNEELDVVGEADV